MFESAIQAVLQCCISLLPALFVAVHHSLILRAENMAEKQQWVSRLRIHTKAAKEQPPLPPPANEAADKGPDASAAESESDTSGAEDSKRREESEAEVGSSSPLNSSFWLHH